MTDLIERLLNAARGEDGLASNVPNTLLREAAAALEAAREDVANAARWRLCTSEHQIEGDEVIKCHVNVGVNVWQGAEWCAFYECSPDELQAAIDQARGKAGGEVEGG